MKGQTNWLEIMIIFAVVAAVVVLLIAKLGGGLTSSGQGTVMDVIKSLFNQL